MESQSNVIIDVNKPLVFLGSQVDFRSFKSLYSRLPWFTYRKGFTSISGDKSYSSITSDSGWGCMLRAGQMILASAMIKSMFDVKDWEYISKEQYVKVLKMFNDFPEADFSIHKIALEGEYLGKPVGSWFGPNTVSACLKNLEKRSRSCNINVFTANESVIKTQELEKAWDFGMDQDGKKSLLLLLPTRLGMNSLNPIYYQSIQIYLGFPQSVGIIGGKPNSAYYFYATQDEQMYYLDPHIRQNVQTIVDGGSGGGVDNDTSSYFCDQLNSMLLYSLDESLAFGFLFKTKLDWYQFCEQVQEIHSNPDFNAVFSIQTTSQSTTDYVSLEGDDFGMSDDDDILNEFEKL
eukprot:TRINITY_DN7190_c0_g1_i1.p1 TRINITY_DN7190_c0_g1~~TRINITY_DN7190_c0_g1_i1.p1  ORF type:complete len:348 (+),score=39.09 TRINITY_DN7190_c0_g1_i1:280-1323(+)